MRTTRSILIEPENTVVWCKYTLLEPVSHHDPGQADKSNFSMYRRQLLRTTIENAGRAIEPLEVQRICDRFPVPVEVVPYFEDEPFSRFIATAILRIFISAYGGAEGTGLFEGMTRYVRLENRCTQTATRVSNLKEFWSVLTKEMQVGGIAGTRAPDLLTLLSIPKSFAASVLYQFSKYSQLIRMLASAWVETEKLVNEKYADKADADRTSGQVVTLEFEMPSDEPSAEISVPVPVHSGNDIRHDIRQGCMFHLLDRLKIGFDDALPLPVRTLLENGGAMAGAQPANAFAKGQMVREAFPHLGLLGGCMPNFMLGESNLQSVAAFWRGRENNAVLSEVGAESEAPVADLLDQWTLTRHSLRTEETPMPFNFETIQAGAELYCRFQFHPFVTDLEQGAFCAGIETWAQAFSAIGGQSAKGFGRVKVDWVKYPDALFDNLPDYENYLSENRERLRGLLIDGSMGVE
jgi:hypothetical protein